MDFIISLELNKKRFKEPMTKMTVCRILGWDVDKIYWNQMPVFNRMVAAGIVIKVTFDRPFLYAINFKKLDEIMDNDKRLIMIGDIGWGRPVLG